MEEIVASGSTHPLWWALQSYELDSESCKAGVMSKQTNKKKKVLTEDEKINEVRYITFHKTCLLYISIANL